MHNMYRHHYHLHTVARHTLLLPVFHQLCPLSGSFSVTTASPRFTLATSSNWHVVVDRPLLRIWHNCPLTVQRAMAELSAYCISSWSLNFILKVLLYCCCCFKCVWVFCLPGCVCLPLEVTRRHQDCLELVVQMVFSCHVGTSTKASALLNYLSSSPLNVPNSCI